MYLYEKDLTETTNNALEMKPYCLSTGDSARQLQVPCNYRFLYKYLSSSSIFLPSAYTSTVLIFNIARHWTWLIGCFSQIISFLLAATQSINYSLSFLITDTPVASWPYMAVLHIVQATVYKNTWFLLPTTFTFFNLKKNT